MNGLERYHTYERKKFIKWQKAVKERLPDAANRVFALRNKHYLGCGFHYSLEGTLGKILMWVNNSDPIINFFHGEGFIASQIIARVVVEGFFKDLARIEREITKIERGKQ